MNTPFFVGLGHYSRTGKDTFANYLIGHLESKLLIRKRPLAWKLKEITYNFYAWAGMMPPNTMRHQKGGRDRDVMLPALGMTPVEVWVAFGTKAVRNNVYDRTWLDYLLKSNHQERVIIIPDVRFPNEADAIKEAGGVLIKIVRPGYGPRKTIADRALVGYTGWDYVFGGEGTMFALKRYAEDFANYLTGQGPQPFQAASSRDRHLSVENIEPWEAHEDPPRPCSTSTATCSSPWTWRPQGGDPATTKSFRSPACRLDAELKPSTIPAALLHRDQTRLPGRAEPQAQFKHNIPMEQLLLHAPSQDRVKDLFVEWFESLDLPFKKSLVPMAHNWAFESSWLKEWLGVTLYDQIWFSLARDGMLLAIAINDRAAMRGEAIPFSHVSLAYSAVSSAS